MHTHADIYPDVMHSLNREKTGIHSLSHGICVDKCRLVSRPPDPPRKLWRLEPSHWPVKLRARSNKPILDNAMKPQKVSRVRANRKNSGLSQRELGEILGTLGPVGISRHERSLTLPKFLVAVGYEIVFGVPIAEIFPGIYEALRLNIEGRLVDLEKRLHQSTAKGHRAILIARKLEWLCERRNL